MYILDNWRYSKIAVRYLKKIILMNRLFKTKKYTLVVITYLLYN